MTDNVAEKICFKCGELKPLEVIWLCFKCHRKEHGQFDYD